MNTNGSKRCPICGRIISANKELCFACVTEHGSLAAYQAAETAKAPAAEPVKKPRAIEQMPEALDEEEEDLPY